MDRRKLGPMLEVLLQCPYIDARAVAVCFLGENSLVADLHRDAMARLRVHDKLHHANICPELLAELRIFAMQMKNIGQDNLREQNVSAGRQRAVKEIIAAADAVISL